MEKAKNMNKNKIDEVKETESKKDRWEVKINNQFFIFIIKIKFYIIKK